MKNMANFGTPVILKILTRFPEEIRPILDQELEFSDQHFEILDSETTPTPYPTPVPGFSQNYFFIIFRFY